MSAILIAEVTIKDEGKFKEYAAAAGSTFEPYDVEFLFKGMVSDVLVGEHPHKQVAIIKFPHKEALNDWYNSDAYQAIAPIRDAGADVTFVAYEAPQAT